MDLKMQQNKVRLTHGMPHMHTYIHTYIQHTHAHTLIYTYMHTYIHTYIHTYVHTSMHTYIHVVMINLHHKHTLQSHTCLCFKMKPWVDYAKCAYTMGNTWKQQNVGTQFVKIASFILCRCFSAGIMWSDRYIVSVVCTEYTAHTHQAVECVWGNNNDCILTLKCTSKLMHANPFSVAMWIMH